jgi:hypothetical protein
MQMPDWAAISQISPLGIAAVGRAFACLHISF